MKDKFTILEFIGLVAIFTAIFSIAIAFSVKSPTPLQQIHAGYNHIQIFEDGSYTAQTIEGQPEQGCINGGLCDE